MRRPIGPIGHCSAKLRKAIEVDEEEALLGTVRIKRRLKTHDDEEKTGSKGGGRFLADPDFSVPGPFSSRPLSPLGHVSFHFSRDTVSKSADGASIVTTSSGTKRLNGSAPADHDGYIARPDAVMTISAADFEAYATRDKAVEGFDTDRGAVISNISDDPLVRRDFWLKVHKHERKPEPDTLEFRRNCLSAADWAKLSTLASLPANVRELVGEMAASDEPRKGKANKPDALLRMDRVKAASVIKTVRSALRQWNGKAPPLRLRQGRGGRTQFRLTAEFAEGLDSAARLRITKQFCGRLQQIGVMYTAAIHEPDEHNNERNFHLHVAYYDRPARIMPGTDLWDFEIREKVSGQHERYRYPHRQPKIGVLVRDPNGGNFRKYAADQIYGLREYFSQLSNEALKETGCARLFDPRTYKEMGIDQEATRPLGPNAAALQAVGVPTAIGLGNAEILGTAALQRVRQECAREAEERQALRAQIAQRLAAWESTGDHEIRSALTAASARFEQAASFVDAHDMESREYEVWLQIIEAGPKKTVDTCSRILKAVHAGEATRSDRNQKDRIEARKVAAEGYLADVWATHERHEDVLRAVRTELKVAKEILASVTAEIAVLLERDNAPSLSAARDNGNEAPDAEVARPSPDSSQLPPVSTTARAGEPIARGDLEGPAEKTVHDRLDELFERILEGNQLIMVPDANDSRFRVPGISRADLKLLNSLSFQPLIHARLAEIAKIQRTRMDNAARFVAVYGEAGFRKLAERHPWHREMLNHYEVYRGHPAFEAIRLEAEQKYRILAGKGDSRTRRARKPRFAVKSEQPGSGKRKKRSLFGRLFGSTEESTISVPPEHATPRSAPPEHATPSWTPATPTERVAKDDRGDAVRALADAIRTCPGVRLVDRQGIVGVDPESMPGWATSLSVFHEEELVMTAIKERRAKEVERANAAVRGQIVSAVRAANRRPVKRLNDRWVVSGIDAKWLQRANEWQDHPDLLTAYRQVDESWRNLEAKVGSDLARHAAKAEAPRPSQASLGPTVPPRQAATTLEQQAEYLARRAQQSR